MEEQKQCGCCSCRCDRLEKELQEQRDLARKYRNIAHEIKGISANFDSLYNNIMDDTQALGTSIRFAENEIQELEAETQHEQK